MCPVCSADEMNMEDKDIGTRLSLFLMLRASKTDADLMREGLIDFSCALCMWYYRIIRNLFVLKHSELEAVSTITC